MRKELDAFGECPEALLEVAQHFEVDGDEEVGVGVVLGAEEEAVVEVHDATLILA